MNALKAAMAAPGVEVDKLTKSLQQQLGTLRLGAEGMELLKLKTLGVADAIIAEVKAIYDSIAAEKQKQELSKRALDMTISLRTAQETYNVGLAEAKMLFDEDAISIEVYIARVKELDKALADSATKSKEWATIAKGLAKDLSQMFIDAVFGAKNFTEALVGILKKLAEMIFDLLVMKPLIEALGSWLGGLGGLIPHAAGGQTFSGSSYLVGEQGPELFVPSSSGMIVPNNMLGSGGAGMTVNNYIDARGADAGVEARVRRALAETENRAVNRSVLATRELGLRTA
jgi:hypothetical protein